MVKKLYGGVREDGDREAEDASRKKLHGGVREDGGRETEAVSRKKPYGDAREDGDREAEDASRKETYGCERVNGRKDTAGDRMRLLIVEDDRLMREVVADYFRSKGWKVLTAGDGETALEVWERESPQLVLLDVMMPGTNGFTVCRRIREHSDVPVIFITARVMEEDELHGYSLGADDYVTKPFSLPVLYAKAMALMGRVRGENPHRKIRCGEIEADVRTHEVFVSGELCALPPIEYEMLLFFMENPNRVFSREQLLIRFWGYDFDGNDRVVDNHIKKLRSALGGSGRRIQTVRKAGYRMEA